MEIVRKNKIIARYYEVEIGTVFVRIGDKDVYMKTNDGAVSLMDGSCYYISIEETEEVQVVKAKLYIED